MDVDGRAGRAWQRRATMVWALVYGGFGLAGALSGTPLIHAGTIRAPVAVDWAVVAVGGLAVPAVAAQLRVLLRVLCGLTAIAAFSLLMDVITLISGEGVDDPAAAVHRALAATGAVLLAATAGRPTAGGAVPAPSAAGPRVQLAAWVGTAAFAPYVAMKLVWVFGGTFAGTSAAEQTAASERNGASRLWLTLHSWGLDGTVLLALLGTFLLWGLVRPWGQVFPRWTPALRGRRVPRWLPLTPALLGAATLAPYGLLGLGYCALAATGAVTMRQGDAASPGDALQMAWIGTAAFACHGLALAVAARSYWQRTRPTEDRSGAAAPAAVG